MARVHATSSRVLLNEISVSADITGYGVSHSRGLSEITTLVDSGMRFIPGHLMGRLTLRGVFDSTAGSFYQEALSTVGVDDAVLSTVLPEGFTHGKPAFITIADAEGFSVDASVAEAVTATIEAQADSGVDWGVLLHVLQAETVDGNSTSIDNAAGTTNGGVASLHVTAYSGFTNVVFKVQHSTDNSVWADLITFTTVTGLTSQRSTVSGTVNRYTRSFWDVTGAGSVTFAMAFARR